MAEETPEARLPNAFADADPEILAYFEEVLGASDRAGAIVAVAQVDNALRSAILSRLKELSPDDEGRLFSGLAAPLQPLHAKIQIGYSLGLFPDAVRQDLIILKDIRNLFAHERDVRTFEHPQVAALCDKLNYPHSVVGVAKGLQSPINMGNPKEKFERTALVFDLTLSSGRNKFFARRPAKEMFIDYPFRPGARAPSPKKAPVRPSNGKPNSGRESPKTEGPPQS